MSETRKFGNRPWVYVAGPYSTGDVVMNVRMAVLVGHVLLQEGFFPLVPHLTHTWHMIAPREYEDWLAYDMEVLNNCDALIRIPGISSGADKEVAFAEANDIKVFHSIEELFKEYPKIGNNNERLQ